MFREAIQQKDFPFLGISEMSSSAPTSAPSATQHADGATIYHTNSVGEHEIGWGNTEIGYLV